MTMGVRVWWLIESEGNEMSPDLNVPEKYNTHDRDTGGFSYSELRVPKSTK